MSVNIKELLDDEEFDPKKLFNEEEYSTVIINREGFSRKDNTTADLIESLLDKEMSREEKEAVFAKLKDAKARQLLMSAITQATRTDDKVMLTAACWESGLDFTGDYYFFVDLACNDDFQLSLEALTVVENCDTVDKNTLERSLERAKTGSQKNPELANDLMEDIRRRLH